MGRLIQFSICVTALCLGYGSPCKAESQNQSKAEFRFMPSYERSVEPSLQLPAVTAPPLPNPEFRNFWKFSTPRLHFKVEKKNYQMVRSALSPPPGLQWMIVERISF